MGVSPITIEAKVGFGKLPVDMHVPGSHGEPGLVVEYHGPGHYCCTEGWYGMEVRTGWKEQVLRGEGFKVLVVPHFEWDVLGEWNKGPYLRGKLRDVGWMD